MVEEMPEVDYGLHGHEYIRKFVALEGQACVFLCIPVEPGFLHPHAGNQGEFAVNKKLESRHGGLFKTRKVIHCRVVV